MVHTVDVVAVSVSASPSRRMRMRLGDDNLYVPLNSLCELAREYKLGRIAKEPQEA